MSTKKHLTDNDKFFEENKEEQLNHLPISQKEADEIDEVLEAAKAFAKVLKKNKCTLVCLDHGWPYHYLHICPKRIDCRRTDVAADVYGDEEETPWHSISTLPLVSPLGIVEMYSETDDCVAVETKRVKDVAKVFEPVKFVSSVIWKP